jgi:hypothetical protein
VAGDVWIDDAHFYRTGINLYRRDFARGIVLVNPTATPMSALLEQNYRRIQGTVDPANDGSTLTQVTVPAWDAVFLIRASATVGVPDFAPAPLAFAAVAPNPAPPGTTCTLRLTGARAGMLRVRVYDAAGRLVRTLHDGPVEAGPRVLTWNGTDEAGRIAARGLYFVRAEQDGRAATRKLVRA